MKKFYLILLLIFLVFNLISCSTKRVISANYHVVESSFLNDFSINKECLLSNKPCQAVASESYKDCLDMMIYSVTVDEYVPDNYLFLTLKHEYNIFATGKEMIQFQIKKQSESETELIIDYFENSNLAGCLPVTIDTGNFEEKAIFEKLLKKIN